MVTTPEVFSAADEPHVVIVGGGFGGLAVTRHLQDRGARITLLDRRNFHLFQPLLYQVATGASHNYFGHSEWETFAPGLKSLEDALRIRSKVLAVFERAELELEVEKQGDLMRFVVIGGGPTGVELAGG